MRAYYNEINPYAAQWLRNLIAEGHVARGDVDERSISDVRPSDLAGYTQCHFFAGIGAPHIRDRNYWVADCYGELRNGRGDAGSRRRSEGSDRSTDGRLEHGIRARLEGQWGGHSTATGQREESIRSASSTGESGGMGLANGEYARRDGRTSAGAEEGATVRPECDSSGSSGSTGGLANQSCDGRREECTDVGRGIVGDRAQGLAAGFSSGSGDCRSSPTNGLWGDADWLLCRDGKWRPVEPGTFPLAHGAASRVGRLRAYGNAIVAEAAEAFIRAYLECAPDRGDDLLIGHNGGRVLDDFEALA